ncbi:MAG TPA: 50S ribosomal protein L18 [Planctomycetota bacterium]|nr:50S ribosomal protein L18 [Planctomycetota bacterium]
MKSPVQVLIGRAKRHLRVRKRVFGTGQRPRLCVFRSNTHIFAQIIDDQRGHTLVAAGSLSKELRDGLGTKKGRGKQAAALVGKLIAERALAQQVKDVVFDRGGYKYHGRVKELADAARKAGLKF